MVTLFCISSLVTLLTNPVSQILVGILRHYVTLLLNSSPKKQPSEAVREQYVPPHPYHKLIGPSPCVSRRALGRAALLRSSAPLSPLQPATYQAFTSTLTHSLASGEYLKTKPPSKEGEESVQNPLEAAGMDGAMEGMKKQAVMMWGF